MATYTGDQGVFKLVTTGGTPAAVGEVRDFEITETAAAIDTSAKGDAWTTNTTGRKSWSVRGTMHMDAVSDAAQADVLAGIKIDLEVLVEGSASGREELSGTALVTSVTRSSPEGDSVASFAFEASGDGTLTHGTVA